MQETGILEFFREDPAFDLIETFDENLTREEIIERQFKIIDSHYACGDGAGELKLLLEAETAEPVFDFLQKRYGHLAGFRIIVIGGLALAFLILATNIVCLNISAVVMFLFQGIRPNRWWEAERARKHTQIVIAVWMFLPILLMLLIQFNSG